MTTSHEGQCSEMLSASRSVIDARCRDRRREGSLLRAIFKQDIREAQRLIVWLAITGHAVGPK